MCTGIALPVSELPMSILERRGLSERIYDRSGQREVRFFWRHSPTLLPAIINGRLRIATWGSKNRRGILPHGGWIPRDQLEFGIFEQLNAESVMIPAIYGHDKGTWFLISQGIHGVAIRDANDEPVVYMLTDKATNYYRNMTEHSPMMPVLIEQTI